MKSLIFILSLCLTSSSFAAEVVATPAENDQIMTRVCESIATNYAQGEVRSKGLKGVYVEHINSTAVVNDRLAVVVDTVAVEDYLMKSGPKLGYFCYRCDATDFRVSVESDISKACQ